MEFATCFLHILSCFVCFLVNVESKYANIRLAGGDGYRKGRVEVFLDGKWGTICDDNWDFNDALVVCRQLGFGDVEKVRRDAFFGEGVGRILMSLVDCEGTERALTECHYDTYQGNYCTHSEDAGVVCVADLLEECPGNVTVSVPDDVIMQRVDWTKELDRIHYARENCSHSSGEFLSTGVTVITCSLTSMAHSWACEFYVTLCPTDYFGIKRLCPTNVTKLIPKDVNATHSQIYWSDLTLTECGYNVSRSHVPGESFPVGVTEVLYIFRGDKFVYRLCSFYVHVIEAKEREADAMLPNQKTDFNVTYMLLILPIICILSFLGFMAFIFMRRRSHDLRIDDNQVGHTTFWPTTHLDKAEGGHLRGNQRQVGMSWQNDTSKPRTYRKCGYCSNWCAESSNALTLLTQLEVFENESKFSKEIPEVVNIDSPLYARILGDT